MQAKPIGLEMSSTVDFEGGSDEEEKKEAEPVEVEDVKIEEN